MLLLLYGGIIIAGILLGLLLPSGNKRFAVRLITGLLALPVVAVAALVTLLRLTVLREPPTLAELQTDFPQRRIDLTTLVEMAEMDHDYSRIAPDFFHPAPSSAAGSSTAPPQRWEEYKRLFARNRIKLGVARTRGGDVFIIVDSVGLLNRGHATGYVHCSAAPLPGSFRYLPCESGQDKGHRDYDRATRAEAYSYQKIAPDWYAYDEGPG